MTAVDTWVESWTARIRPHMVKAVEGIVDTGRTLLEARETAPHGAWGPLCAELGMTPRTAHRLMEIARHPVIADRTHASDLPAAWTTLYELSRVDPAQLSQAIDDGRVTPELGRVQAAELGVGRLDAAEARALTEQIRGHIEDLWAIALTVDDADKPAVRRRVQECIDHVLRRADLQSESQ